ncbi:unnamed protein product [Bemisia tabaci]|uniref:Zinc finger protein 865 n=1 Tax=Bemisia tabaci TaxID=7038 RepID=A0A9P0AL42_BEMTA|nr:unnamed protein product [Bemisia tabaci]
MDGPLEWVPDVQLKKEVVSDESTEYEEYRIDLRQDTMLHVKSEFGQKQPVVFLEKLDLTSFNSRTGYTGDQQNSPVPFQEPHSDYQEEPDVDFRDNLAESAPLERKYVTSSLLPRIKVEEAEEDENPLTELVSKSAILRLVLKQESDVGSSTNEPYDSRPEINHQDETVTGKSKGDGTHQIISGRNSNRRKNPVVLLERLDPVLVRYHLKTSDSAPSSSRSAPSLFQVKTEGRSGVNHGSVHNYITENEGIYRMTVNIHKLSLRKEQKVSKMKAVETFTSNKDTNKLLHKTTGKFASKCSPNPPNNTNSSSLRGHVVDGHTKDETFSCDMCSEIFNSITSVKEHLRISHKNEQQMFLRRQCPSTFKIKHILCFACTQCSRQFQFKKDLQIHLKSVHNNQQPFPFARCSMEFKGKKTLQVHTQCVLTEVRPFSCNQCSRTFNFKSNLKTHVQCVHDGSRPFSCHHCSRQWKTKSQLRTHLIRVHNPDQPFSCDQCSRTFSWKNNLRRHVLRVHGEDRPFACGQCSKSFKSKGDLTYHLKCAHSANRPFSCNRCFRTFNLKSHLNRHVFIVHSDDRPFSCSQCSKSFKSKGDLTQHRKGVHSDDRPYSCGQCSKSFKLKGDLTRHLMCVHSIDRPFSCNQCSRTFSLKCLLKNHVSTVHSEERLFSCGQCSKASESKDDLKMHLKCVHSADRPFS